MDATTLDFDVDLDSVWHSVGGGACVAAAVTLVRIGLDYAFRHGERRMEREDRRGAHQRDAEARLERVLQDRLSGASRSNASMRCSRGHTSSSGTTARMVRG